MAQISASDPRCNQPCTPAGTVACRRAGGQWLLCSASPRKCMCIMPGGGAQTPTPTPGQPVTPPPGGGGGTPTPGTTTPPPTPTDPNCNQPCDEAGRKACVRSFGTWAQCTPYGGPNRKCKCTPGTRPAGCDKPCDEPGRIGCTRAGGRWEQCSTWGGADRLCRCVMGSGPEPPAPPPPEPPTPPTPPVTPPPTTGGVPCDQDCTDGGRTACEATGGRWETCTRAGAEQRGGTGENAGDIVGGQGDQGCRCIPGAATPTPQPGGGTTPTPTAGGGGGGGGGTACNQPCDEAGRIACQNTGRVWEQCTPGGPNRKCRCVDGPPPGQPRLELPGLPTPTAPGTIAPFEPPAVTPPELPALPEHPSELGDVTLDPGYEFRRAQGLRALREAANAAGIGLSGDALKQMQAWGQQFASGEYARAYERLNERDKTRYNRAVADYDRRMRAALTQYGFSDAAFRRALAAHGAQRADVLAQHGMNQRQFASLMERVRTEMGFNQAQFDNWLRIWMVGQAAQISLLG